MVWRVVIGCLVACLASVSAAEVPDGTVILSESYTPLGKIVRVAGHTCYTHVGIVLDGYVYEATPPVVRRVPLASYGTAKAVYDYYYPDVPYSTWQVAKMKAWADSQLGKKYGLSGYYFPNAASERKTYCARFAGDLLNHSGAWRLSREQSHVPETLWRSIDPRYTLRHSERK